MGMVKVSGVGRVKFEISRHSLCFVLMHFCDHKE